MEADASVPEVSRKAEVPSPFRSTEGRMIVLFDVLWMVFALPIWGLPALASAAVLWGAGALVGWHWAAVAVPLAYFVFLLGLITVLAVTRMLIPAEREGASRVFADRDFFVFLLHWGLSHYAPRPLLHHIHLITGLRTLYYKALGAKLGWSTHISPGAQLWSPSLMTLGHLCYIGEFAHVTAHLSLGDKVLLAPIRLGHRTNLGAHVHMGPGCTVGDDVRIGALTDIAPAVTIEDGVEIGPRCTLAMGAKVGRGAVLEPRTFLDVYATVPPGERWGGDPAHKLGEVIETAVRRKRRGRG